MAHIEWVSIVLTIVLIVELVVVLRMIRRNRDYVLIAASWNEDTSKVLHRGTRRSCEVAKRALGTVFDDARPPGPMYLRVMLHQAYVTRRGWGLNVMHDYISGRSA